MTFVKFWTIAACALLLLGAPSSVLGATGATTPTPTPTETTGTSPAGTNAGTTTTASSDDPTDGESFVAVLAILGAITFAVAVVWLVKSAHDLQAGLAATTMARGGTVSTGTTPAAGGAETAAAAANTIAIAGPNEVAVGTAGEFKVDTAVANPAWSVSGIGSFTQLLKDDDHTFVFTPHEEKAEVKIKVTDSAKTGEKPVNVLAAAKSSLVVRVAVRNWGLVVVAVAIVFGAIALGVTGHLDGANFVALVAPLAALLGITAALTERGAGGGGGGSASGGASAGAAGGGTAGT